jgi:hypothetical protein
MRIILSIILAAVPLAAGVTALNAAPLVGQQLGSRIVNGEFRGYARTQRGFENQIWHFLPDGRIRAVAESSRIISLHGHHQQQWQDIGAWRLEDDRICIGFQGINRDLDGCYVVDAGPGKQVRFAGPYVWQGTLETYE